MPGECTIVDSGRGRECKAEGVSVCMCPTGGSEETAAFSPRVITRKPGPEHGVPWPYNNSRVSGKMSQMLWAFLGRSVQQPVRTPASWE